MKQPMLLLLASGLLAWVGTRLALHHAGRLGLVQAPIHRSSHVIPTPHGGGLGIVLGGSVAGTWLAWVQGGTLWPISGLAFSLAVLGLWDDIRHLPARTRFAVQVLLCALLLQVLGFSTPLALAGLLLFAGVWWVNLFNFMDGIDGIAASQAVFMLVTGAGLGFWHHPGAADAAGWLWMLAIAAATLGFMVFNWPPARIFMGDIGSTYLAFMIFALALLSVREGWLTYPAWLVLGAVFVADASLTLLRRMLAGARWFEAHRSHAYQRLSRRWGSHRRVTLLVISFNLLWLAPLAWACLAWPQWSWIFTVLAYVPLATVLLALGAGKQD
jgi:Fuc2NAc and GlcNAc transferase